MDEEGFWAAVDKSGDCWLWTMATAKGYGRTRMELHGARVQLAHRAAYILTHGPIPDGQALAHLCRNRGCVNPDHLEPCSHAENMARMRDHWAGRGQWVNGVLHCPKGHPLTPENILNTGRQRKCRPCDKLTNAAWVERNRVRLRAYQVVKQREYRQRRKQEKVQHKAHHESP